MLMESHISQERAVILQVHSACELKYLSVYKSCELKYLSVNKSHDLYIFYFINLYYKL